MQNAERLRARLQQPGAAIMGIVNTTPDSFSDGGLFVSTDVAVKYALSLIDQGADIVDVGGESTRPGADKVSQQEELDRVIPVIEKLCGETDALVSIDSYKPLVMAEAVSAGASMINDINALREEGAVDCAKNAKVPVCIMHMAGQPKTMQQQPQYHNVVDEVIEFLSGRIHACQAVGIAREDIVVDPGIGFGKTLTHNLALLSAVAKLREHTNCEVLIGASRKSMIDAILTRPVEQRLHASVGLAVQAVLNGAKIVRVHDVRASFDAIRCVEAVQNA